MYLHAAEALICIICACIDHPGDEEGDDEWYVGFVRVDTFVQEACECCAAVAAVLRRFRAGAVALAIQEE